MSVWSKIGKWGARIGGYALAPVTGGASIPVGEAIAQGVGNWEASNEANKAIQAGATQGVDTYNRAFGPYMDMGGQAANTLSGLMGFAPSSGSAPGVSPTWASSTARAFTGEPTGKAQPRQPMVDAPGTSSLAELARPQVQSASSYQRVRMRAPDGTEEDVDPQDVGLFEQHGARRLS